MACWYIKIKRYTKLVIGGSIHIICILIIFPQLGTCDAEHCLIYMTILGITYGIYLGPVQIWAMNLLPDVRIRYTAFAITRWRR